MISRAAGWLTRTDARVVRTQGLIMMWLIAVMHGAWSVTLFVRPLAHKATPVNELYHWLGDGTAFALLGVSIAALLAVHVAPRRPMLQMALVSPQQAALFVTALGTIQPIWTGQYPDGTLVTSAHVFVDQSVYVVLAVMHLVSMIGPRAYSPCAQSGRADVS